MAPEEGGAEGTASPANRSTSSEGYAAPDEQAYACRALISE
jgi:hypothetical protein